MPTHRQASQRARTRSLARSLTHSTQALSELLDSAATQPAKDELYKELAEGLAPVSERFPLIPLQNCLFPPELQRQLRGK